MNDSTTAVRPFSYPRLHTVRLQPALHVQSNERVMVACGYISNDRRFPNGKTIRTSPLSHFEQLDTHTLLLHTRNSIYQIDSFHPDVLNELLK